MAGMRELVNQRRARWRFHLSGGRVFLDFANTVSWRTGAQPIDRLRDYGDFVEWARQARLIGAREASALERQARRRPRQASAALRRVRALREAIYDVFTALAGRHRPDAAAVDLLQREFRRALRHLGLAVRPRGFAVTWVASTDAPTRLLGLVARAAAESLVADDLTRLRVCRSPRCGWVFLDTTRSATRRWCAMSVCGNRAKAQRHYRRRRSRPAG
jgi:predicted RNA-binding Zn ribbon-like protein